MNKFYSPRDIIAAIDSARDHQQADLYGRIGVFGEFYILASIGGSRKIRLRLCFACRVDVHEFERSIKQSVARMEAVPAIQLWISEMKLPQALERIGRATLLDSSLRNLQIYAFYALVNEYQVELYKSGVWVLLIMNDRLESPSLIADICCGYYHEGYGDVVGSVRKLSTDTYDLFCLALARDGD